MKIKIYIHYFGLKNLALEEKIKLLAEKCNGSIGGEWGYAEHGFSCLFVFKKQTHLEIFKNNFKKDLINYRVKIQE